MNPHIVQGIYLAHVVLGWFVMYGAARARWLMDEKPEYDTVKPLAEGIFLVWLGTSQLQRIYWLVVRSDWITMEIDKPYGDHWIVLLGSIVTLVGGVLLVKGLLQSIAAGKMTFYASLACVGTLCIGTLGSFFGVV